MRVDQIQRLDEYSMRSFATNNITFAQIKDFKGLENDAIVAVDFPDDLRIEQNRSYAYVAMSRARSVLVRIQMIQ